MELWGTLRHKISGGAVDSDSDAYVQQFFDATPEEDAWALAHYRDAVTAFVTQHVADGRRVALVTSGSATVPLNDQGSMDAVSYGDRGAASAEQLLRAGYAVLFLHRQGSLAPFSRHFQRYIQDNVFMSMCQMDDEGSLVFRSDDADRKAFIAEVLESSQATSARLFHLRFTTVQQYMHYLRMASMALEVVNTRGLILLGASVLDYYVPSSTTTAIYSNLNADSMPTSPSQKEKNALTLNLVRTPNLIRKIRKEYAPTSFLITLKAVADKNLMHEAAYNDIERWGVDLVVANSPMLPDELALISEQEEFIVAPKLDNDVDLDTLCAAALVEAHRNFTTSRAILKQSKALLLMTAKFSMMKENDTLNVDADGNKNVPFKIGVRVRVDRSLGDASPIYELKHIFQNRSHCARVHIWQRVDGDMDVMVAFSPAGTPDTVRALWGDFWGGWAEDEIAEFKEQVGHLSLGSALYGLAQGVTATVGGDYSQAHQMLSYIASKIGSAWSEGEQTRIRQAIQNMLAVNFNRGLVEWTDLHSVDDLRFAASTVPTLQRSGTMTCQEAEMLSMRRKPRSGSGDLSNDGESDDDKYARAEVVKVHKALLSYFDEMVQEGLIDAVLPYVANGIPMHVTGYSMGGMLGQLFCLKLADVAFAKCNVPKCNLANVTGVFFGTPRVGDAGFAARLKLLYGGYQLLNVMHPLDTVHAFPPTSEGYADAMLKVFLKEDGASMGRRRATRFSMLPLSRRMDKLIDAAKARSTEPCKLCARVDHETDHHRCRYCTRRGDHRGDACPYRAEGCVLCGSKRHATGEHRCSVCAQYGHRGRDCHQQSTVGTLEMLAYFRFHDFLYYNNNLKKSVEFSTG
ncbi:hypothetical protein SPRG_12558 [Saprolegnia parasitica CBS 223.65]|uniref:Fungal lipase-type domain-containing protein n=1 Tax=Saprolegnia parasitica (strain CBS 223.65) TaxID=695850 RepID=A0A067BWC4_SAPPC|nr:hypothetical protein SPRG_12558 [Saprolegnia parasitica CBS 223.65]KDO22578.1 hypothetical protein SPRG_12558 [Saprolegnia parasitica CBS 223.65]|eukprot:XP_012206694.1 hypothetical protein SPRG_12558 [Saprolegnia parasitica CBS 223.65]